MSEVRGGGRQRKESEVSHLRRGPSPPPPLPSAWGTAWQIRLDTDMCFAVLSRPDALGQDGAADCPILHSKIWKCIMLYIGVSELFYGVTALFGGKGSFEVN